MSHLTTKKEGIGAKKLQQSLLTSLFKVITSEEQEEDLQTELEILNESVQQARDRSVYN